MGSFSEGGKRKMYWSIPPPKKTESADTQSFGNEMDQERGGEGKRREGKRGDVLRPKKGDPNA